MAPEDFLSTLADIERRIVNLERSPRLTSASIKDGALTVLDAAGIPRVKIGKDGSDYGVKILDPAGANAVSLAALAFGQNSAQVDPEESTTSTSYTDLATPGPTIAVTVGPSGRVIALASAYMTATVPNQTVVMGLAVDGTMWTGKAVATSNNSGGGIAGDFFGANLIDGLTPGPHTLQAKYLQTLPGATGRFATRWLLALPY